MVPVYEEGLMNYISTSNFIYLAKSEKNMNAPLRVPIIRMDGSF